MAEAVKVAVKEKQIEIEGLRTELSATVRAYEDKCNSYEVELVRQNIAWRNKVMLFTLGSLTTGYVLGKALK